MANTDEILRDKLNGKLNIVQNRRAMESNTDEDDDDEDDEDMPEETGTPKIYDTSESDERYAPIRTNPEKDALQTTPTVRYLVRIQKQT